MTLKMMQNWTRGFRAACFIVIAWFIALVPVGVCQALMAHTDADAVFAILALLWMLLGAPCVLYSMLKQFQIGFKDWFVADGEMEIIEQHGGQISSEGARSAPPNESSP